MESHVRVRTSSEESGREAAAIFLVFVGYCLRIVVVFGREAAEILYSGFCLSVFQNVLCPKFPFTRVQNL